MSKMSVLRRITGILKLNKETVKVVSRGSHLVPRRIVEEHRKSLLNVNRIIQNEKSPASPQSITHTLMSEFLPNPMRIRRDTLSEMLERRDMLKRLSVIHIPEFYVGSIMAVTVADCHTSDKQNRFVGICIDRGGVGLRANFTLRNAVDGQGMEITYDMFCPHIMKIEVLKLEKRLDRQLFYLRDAPLKYSTYSLDMVPIQHPPNEPVPVNDIKVKLNPRPWQQRWERMDLKGVEELIISEKMKIKSQHPDVLKSWNKHDLMKQYRSKINDDEVSEIMSEVFDQLTKVNKSRRSNGKSSKS